MRISELIGTALDLAVAIAEGYTFRDNGEILKCYKDGIFSWDWFPRDRASSSSWAPSIHWEQGGPIIEREKLMLWHDTRYTKYWWRAKHENNAVVFYGPTPLIAAMRCYVASKLGDEVEVPEELL